MRGLVRAALGLVLAAAAASGLATAATAADECRGLQVCLPVAGPWVALPARALGGAPPRVDYELRCPLRGYIVAGIDVRLADPDVDVSFRGETGSPVSPGVTTSQAVLFTGTHTGARRTPTSFRPFVGCVPTSGGGGRDQTSLRRTSAPTALRPTRPLERRVVSRRLRPGTSVEVVARCRRGTRLVSGGHAVAFFTDAAPGGSLLGAVRVTRRTRAGAVVATAAAAATLPADLRVEVQVQALCARDTR